MSENCSAIHRFISSSVYLKERGILSFSWRFTLCCIIGMGLLYFGLINSLLQPVLIVLSFLVGHVLEQAGLLVIIFGQKVVLPGIFGVDIAMECSGVSQLILFMSGVIAYPASNRSKLVGMILATAAVFAGNLIRLLTLFWIGVYARAYFDFFHFYIWGGLSYAGLILLWLLWLRKMQ